MSEIEYDTIEEPKKKSKIGQFLAKWGGLTFFLLMITAVVILAVLKVSFGQWLADIVITFYHRFGPWGIYLGVAIISVFGNFTVIFPVPYTVALIVIGAFVPGVNPILVGLAAGFGAGIGEVSAWLIGRGGREFIKSEKTERMKQYIEKGWAPVLIFIFAATPLPDDAFLVVVGYTGYSVFKTLFWCFLGKVVLCTFTTAIPVWIQNYSPEFAAFLYRLFGINYNDAINGIVSETPPTWGDILISTSVWIGIIVVTFLLISIDWDKAFRRVKEKHESHPPRALKKGVKFHLHEGDDQEEPVPKEAQTTENEKK
ncbi:MAG: VTT domain-containing protein [Promethearchaeota archaeon]